jgi:hypothetical protein
VVVAQVPFKPVPEPLVSLTKPAVCLPELLVSVLLREGKLTYALHGAADDTRQTTDHARQAVNGSGQAANRRGNLVYPDTKLLEVRSEASTICRKLCLLMQQKLHRALHFLWRHRLEFHEYPPIRLPLGHYAIVPSMRRSKVQTSSTRLPRLSKSGRRAW